MLNYVGVLRLIEDFAVCFDLEFAIEFASRLDVDFLSVFNVSCRRRCSFSFGLEVELVLDV